MRDKDVIFTLIIGTPMLILGLVLSWAILSSPKNLDPLDRLKCIIIALGCLFCGGSFVGLAVTAIVTGTVIVE